MLDINYIRENKDLVAQAAKNKNRPVDLDALLSLDEECSRLITQIQDIRQKRNVLAKQGNTPDNQVAGKQIKEELKELEQRLNESQEKYTEILLAVPNVTHPDMPIGKDDSENVVLRRHGTIREFNFIVKDHVELGEALDMIDIKSATEVSGPRFYYLKNQAVLLQMALIQFVFNTLTNATIVEKIAQSVGNPNVKPFVPMIPPVLMKKEVMKKMDRLDPIDDRFYLEKDEMILVGSAEHTMGPYYMNQTLDEKDLPIRFVGYSSAFRREAGSYGKDTRGILRVHQFDKLEMETFSMPEQGQHEQNLLVGVQEYMLQQLEIPYEVMEVCTGDTGKPDYRQIDINCWIPSQNTYRETHSADYMTDYQARRLKIKFKQKSGEKGYVHMNDATAFAVGRILIALMENHQQEDGSISIPKALQPLAGFDTIKPL
jgi:seryl-tRNA synthetase